MDRLVILSLLAVCLLGANLYVSYCVFRAPSYGAWQKVAQVALTWLLPVVGVLLVRSFLNEAPEQPVSSSGEGLGEMGPMDLITTNTNLTGGGHATYDHDA